uniref:hypothetical protein n=1 Tax=uncultured Roseivirga sp. TaxID=543088 RepID=UPI00258B5175
MKKIYSFMGFWLLTIALNAQTNAYRNAINPVFQNLDNSFITTGLLWDYGVNLAEPLEYDGTLTSDNQMTRMGWGLLYANLLTQKIKNTSYSMASQETIKNSIISYNASDVDKVNI